jgi:hypothetical protein
MADALARTMRARLRLVRNGADYFDQVFYDPDIAYNESTHQRVVLNTSMSTPSEVDITNVTTGATTPAGAIFLQTDRDILVALDTNTSRWPVNENGALMLVGSFTHLYLMNESTTNQATVELVVTG